MLRDKVILAYSGGLDTSVMVPWIGEKYNLEVVTFTVDLGQGEDIEQHPPKGPQNRCSRCRRPGCPQPLRRSLRLARPDGRCRLRREVPARHRPGPAAHRQADGRYRPQAWGQGRGPRLHRQGERPGPLRCHFPDAGPRPANHRPGTRVEDDAPGRDRVRPEARHSGRGDQGKPVQPRPEPVGPKLRGRRPGGPLGGAARRGLWLDRCPGKSARPAGVS